MKGPWGHVRGHGTHEGTRRHAEGQESTRPKGTWVNMGNP